MLIRLISSLLIVTALPAAAASRTRAVAAPHAFPECSIVRGSAAVTFSHDGGQTLAPTAESLSGIGYTYGLTVVDAAGTLMAWHKSNLLLSTDHGCSWRIVGTFVDPDVYPPALVSATSGRVYAWSDNRSFLVRYDTRGAVKMPQPVPFVGFGIDSADPDRVRGGGADGTVWESVNAGESWVYLGSLRTSANDPMFYRFSFDPADLNHIVAGTVVDGAFVSRDGGVTWKHAAGLGAGSVNVFNAVISPADPKVVWAMGINLAESDANVPSQGRHIFRSTDGGETYAAVVDQSATVTLINGPVMAADPRNPDVLWFVFGTYFAGYGTDLYRYDAFSGTLTTAHNNYDGVNAIAFSHARANLMYLGLEIEQGR